MMDPYITKCGHAFEKSAIEQWYVYIYIYIYYLGSRRTGHARCVICLYKWKIYPHVFHLNKLVLL